MQDRPEISPEQMARFTKTLLLAVGIPLVIAAIFTLMQWYPATYVIDYMTDDQGKFPAILTIILNWAALAAIEIVVLLLALPVVKLIRSKSTR